MWELEYVQQTLPNLCISPSPGSERQKAEVPGCSSLSIQFRSVAKDMLHLTFPVRASRKNTDSLSRGKARVKVTAKMDRTGRHEAARLYAVDASVLATPILGN